MTKKMTSRVAGLLYWAVVATGIFSFMYVPSKLLNDEDVQETVMNIKNSQLLFRLGIVSGLLCYGFFLFLPLVLYKLLQHVNRNAAKLMVLLAIITVPMYFINTQNQLMVLDVIKTPYYSSIFNAKQINEHVFLYLNQYNEGMRLLHIFSGLWLLPFGYLVFKSNFLPKLFGILLFAGGIGYISNFAGYMLIPNYTESGMSTYISLPATFGEIGICLWLLIVGAKEKPTHQNLQS